MERPKIETPCENCGHPYVRHTLVHGDDRFAGYRKHLGCRECDCKEFVMPVVVPEDLADPATIVSDIAEQAQRRAEEAA